MGSIHELITTHGKEVALATDTSREVIEAAAAYLADEEGGTGFLYSGWCQSNLPHKKIADDQVWEVIGESVRLVVRPGLKPANGIEGDLAAVGVPYGARARLILLYLQSEAMRTQNPEVELGKSMNSWMERIGISWGGKSAAMVREQADRISRCSLTFHVRIGDKVGLLNHSIVEAALFDQDGDGRMGSPAKSARLSAGFFQQLQKHPVPLEEAAVRAIANNSQALDVYAWLAYRLHVLKAPTPVSWAALKGQFGLGAGRMTDFRRMFLKSLDLASAVYPAAKVDAGRGGVTLYPSRPPVPPTKMIGAR